MKVCLNVSIESIKPGMILGEDIFHGGNLLLPRGAVIKPSYISHLLSRGIVNVPVRAEKSYYNDIITNPAERFYTEAYETVSNIIDNLKNGTLPNISEIFPVVEYILDKVFTYKNSILLLTGFREKCNYYYAHSLDVCIYSLIAAKAMNLDYEDLITLGVGALLHDIGKVKIPDSIIFKQGPLTDDEFEKIKMHPIYGYNIVRNIAGIKHNSAKIILQHHERCDGSGYPNNSKSGAIYFLSKIVTVADIYDALTSNKVYRSKVLPHEAAEYILCISKSLIDSEIARVFLKNIAIYPRGCQVLLNTNEIAVVLDANEQMPLRPILRIVTDRDKNPLKCPYEFDLQSHPDIFIVHMFN